MPLALPQRGAPVPCAGQLTRQRLHSAPPFALWCQRFQQPLPFPLHLRHVGSQFRQRLFGNPRFLSQRLGPGRQAGAPCAQVRAWRLSQVSLPFHQLCALRRPLRRRASGLLDLLARRRQVLLQLRAPQRRLRGLPTQVFRRFGHQRRQRVRGLLLASFRGLELPGHHEQPVSSQRHLALTQFALQVCPALGHLRLLAQRVQSGLDLCRQIPQALEIPPRLRQASPGLIAPRVVAGHPRRFLQERSPILRAAAATPAPPGPG